jgi:hypothetical protein
MNIRTASSLACLTAGFVLALPAAADAASLRLRCEKRFDPARSKVSVDGRNVSPNAIYTARVISGTNQATAKPKAAVGDEVEFDFDSNPNDIRAGATAIGANFIRNGSVRAAIFNADGNVVAGPATVACEIRR